MIEETHLSLRVYLRQNELSLSWDLMLLNYNFLYLDLISSLIFSPFNVKSAKILPIEKIKSFLSPEFP